MGNHRNLLVGGTVRGERDSGRAAHIGRLYFCGLAISIGNCLIHGPNERLCDGDDVESRAPIRHRGHDGFLDQI